MSLASLNCQKPNFMIHVVLKRTSQFNNQEKNFLLQQFFSFTFIFRIIRMRTITKCDELNYNNGKK